MAALAYGALEKTVTIRLDGRAAQVRSFALTVGDVLDRSGIRLGPQDWVDPPVGRRLREGQSVEVRRAKKITILLNGAPRRVITTALTVDEVLEDLRVRRTVRDFVGPSRSAVVAGGMTIVYREAVPISVAHDGKTERVITNATSVDTVLRELGVDLGTRDRVEPSPQTYPSSGMLIKVLRVGDRHEVVDRAIDYPVVYRPTLNMEYGTTRVLREGESGIRRLRYLSTFVDGKRVSSKLVGNEILRQPRTEIVAVGRGYPGCTCNHGSQSGEASWYEIPGLTAAHPWLPFGTVVRVENVATGAVVNVVIRDRGPYVPGRIIDLSDSAFERIASLGTGVVDVRIRW